MTIKKRVKYFLQTVKSCRKSDNLLIALMWAEDLERKTNSMDSKTFLKCLAEGELTNFDSIRKAKGVILKENPEWKN